MERAEAKRRFLNSMSGAWLEEGDGYAVLDGETMEKPYGWIFFYQSRKYLETGDEGYMLAGNGPVAVLRDGSVHHLGSGSPAGEAIRAFEVERGDI